MPKSRRHMRSWNAALAAVQSNVAILSARENLIPGARQACRSVNQVCNRLAFPKVAVAKRTTAELASKYACSERTIRYWKRHRAPLARGQPAMLDWLARRSYVPKGTGVKFHRQLQARRLRLHREGYEPAYRRLRTLKIMPQRRQTAATACHAPPWMDKPLVEAQLQPLPRGKL